MWFIKTQQDFLSAKNSRSATALEESEPEIAWAKIPFFEYHIGMFKIRKSHLPLIWALFLGLSLLFSQRMGLAHTIWHTYSSIHQQQPDSPSICHDCEQLTHAGESVPMAHFLWVSLRTVFLVFPQQTSFCPDNYPPHTHARDPPISTT